MVRFYYQLQRIRRSTGRSPAAEVGRFPRPHGTTWRQCQYTVEMSLHCGNASKLWKCCYIVVIPLHCGNTTTLWQCHYTVAMTPYCGNTTTLWQCHHSAAMPLHCGISRHHLPTYVRQYLYVCGSENLR